MLSKDDSNCIVTFEETPYLAHAGKKKVVIFDGDGEKILSESIVGRNGNTLLTKNGEVTIMEELKEEKDGARLDLRGTPAEDRKKVKHRTFGVFDEFFGSSSPSMR